MEILVHMRRRSFIIALVLSAFIVAPGRAQDYQQDADRLAPLLNWQPGSVVADIGAGKGEMTLAAAKRVGATGRVYTTELDAKKLAQLEELAAKEKNITALRAGETQTNLPPECCDSIFMRLVYHHLTKPAEIDASLFRSLKPGGLLAVIDEEPRPGTKKAGGCTRKPRRARRAAENPDRGTHLRGFSGREVYRRLARQTLLRGLPQAQA